MHKETLFLFLFFFRKGPCPHFFFRGPATSTCLQQSFFVIILNGSILPSVFLINFSLRSPRQELTGDDRGTHLPAVAGRLFCSTIRPGRLSLPSVAYEFTSIPGRVKFPFLLRPCSRYPNSRKCVHTPLTWRGIHSREQTHLLHTPRGTPSCISIQDQSRRVEVRRGTPYSEYPPTKKRCVVRWFDQKCYADAQDYPFSRKLRGHLDYFTTTGDRP